MTLYCNVLLKTASASMLKLGFNQLFSKQATCPQAKKPCLLNQAFAQVNLDLLLDFVGLCWALLGWELVRKLWNRETLSITAASNASGGSSYNMSSLEFENFAGKALLLRVAVESVFLSIVRVSRIPTKWQPKGSKSKFFKQRGVAWQNAEHMKSGQHCFPSTQGLR